MSERKRSFDHRESRRRQRLGGRPCLAILVWGGAALTALGCGDPPLDAGLEPQLTGVLSGDVVISGPLPSAHAAILFLTRVSVDEQGAPVYETVNVTVTPADAFFEGDSGGNAIRTGPFIFSLVPAGDYVVTGIIDMDDNFNPLVQTLPPDPNPDIPGGYVNPATGQPILLHLEAGQALDEVNVIFSVAAPE